MDEQAGQPTTPDNDFEQYEALRPLMFSIAYRMLGSVGEAEDIVQEAFLRLHGALSRGAIIDSPKAFLTTATTRLAIDSLRSARARHEAYVGYWLPEPVTVSLDPDPADLAEKNDSLSLAFLVLLQTLSPVERAVFLLREVFDYDYDEIATTVQKSEDNCRQIFARAKRHIDAGKPRFDANPQEHIELARRFFDAAVDGDMASLVKFLAAEAGFYGDGGGKAHAYPEPIFGQQRVALIIRSLMFVAEKFNVTFRFALVNGQPGAVSFDADGRLISALALDIDGGVIQTVRSIVNPDKLTHLGLPVSDLARIKPREP